MTDQDIRSIPLVEQGFSLQHAELMLFIDDHETQARKLHPLLNQGMRADRHLSLAGP